MPHSWDMWIHQSSVNRVVDDRGRWGEVWADTDHSVPHASPIVKILGCILQFPSSGDIW